jgi:SAM-dependent methyltransferase
MTAVTDAAYSLDNAWEHARRRLQLVERCYDPGTMRRLAAIGIAPGWRCLEVGAGAGSVTRWLCDTVGPAGRVCAVDIDTRFVEEIRADNLDVLTLDVTTAGAGQALGFGTFDFIHTRALLMHLPQREQVLDLLVALLKPGGWLLLEEGDLFPVAGLGAGGYAQAWAGIEQAFGQAGVDCRWARRLPEHLVARGIEQVQADCDVPLVEGGTPEAELFVLTATQIRDAVLSAGTTVEQLAVFEVELATPGRWLPAFALMTASGRKRA